MKVEGGVQMKHLVTLGFEKRKFLVNFLGVEIQILLLQADN